MPDDSEPDQSTTPSGTAAESGGEASSESTPMTLPVDSGSSPSPRSPQRPMAVYAILAVVFVVLALLMIIVYNSGSDRAQPDQPICTTISIARAEQDIRNGKVERLTVGFDQTAVVATDPTWGPVLARLDYQGGSCSYLPQGLMNQSGLLKVIGAVAFYNETTESAQVALVYNQMANLDPALFATPTEEPLPTDTPTEIPTVTPTMVSTERPTEPVEPTIPRVATPAGTPVATPTEGLSMTPAHDASGNGSGS